MIMAETKLSKNIRSKPGLCCGTLSCSSCIRRLGNYLNSFQERETGGLFE
jgi:hypothetical protein